MFRLILDIAEINIDQVKLPKVPGIGMIKRLPNDQKFAMLVNVINAQKAKIIRDPSVHQMSSPICTKLLPLCERSSIS